MLSAAVLCLWAKRSEKNGTVHPLACHLLDAAHVALELWDAALAAGLRAHFAQAFGSDEDCARAWLACLAGLHDLGKALPGSQGRDPATPLALAEARSPPSSMPAPRGHAT